MAEAQTLARAGAQAPSGAALQLERQVRHWVGAAHRLALDDLAGPEAWSRLEQYLGVALRAHLGGVVARLHDDARALEALLQAARSGTAYDDLARRLTAFRRQYLRTETTLDYFADALNTRTNPRMGALLRACDTLAHRSMAQVLEPLGHPTPAALTYLDKGLGASILKAGLRLWDGGQVCPVATIKITRHNLLRPTALIHEAGHQVAHITGWNDELRDLLTLGLQREHGASVELAGVWAGWASEIAADAFALAHTGYASVAALHDVLASSSSPFRYSPGDPHPISYLRVLLGAECCGHLYGSGPWTELAAVWSRQHDLESAPDEVRRIVADSIPLLRAIASMTFDQPLRAFGGRALRHAVVPEQVAPRTLAELEARIGPALFTSAHWLWSEPLRLLALTGLRLAERPIELKAILERQEQAMLRLGGAVQPA